MSKETESPAAEAAEPELTAAKVAKLLAGRKVLARAGKDTKERAVRADDILSFRIDGARVTAVTIDGRRHEAELR